MPKRPSSGSGGVVQDEQSANAVAVKKYSDTGGTPERLRWRSFTWLCSSPLVLLYFTKRDSRLAAGRFAND
jgi:hypothetical protein